MGAGFVSGEGRTRHDAVENLRHKVHANGGEVHCDRENICYVRDANGVKFRITLTEFHTTDGRPYWQATQGVTAF